MDDVTTTADATSAAALIARIEQLEARVDALEAGAGSSRTRSSSGVSAGRASSAGAPHVLPGWTVAYEVTELEPADSWIEIHEHSARPHLHRMISAVVATEGPVTELLVLRRVREAWGLRRAGARVQATFDQALRQLSYSGKLDRSADGVLTTDGNEVAAVRVPTEDERTRRAVDEIPPGELELALVLTVKDAGTIAADDATLHVSKLFGWHRRGAEIQSTLDARLDSLIERGQLVRSGTSITVAAGSSD